jgi:5'-3' exonuclease
MNYILIDGSYFIFYRLFALLNWWKLSHPDEPIGKAHNNTEFVDKFRTIIIRKIQEIPKKLGIDDPIIIVGKDCKRENIWRLNFYPEYKQTRASYNDTDDIQPGEFFKLVYEEDLFTQAGCHYCVKHSQLEADDCLALTTKYLLDTSRVDVDADTATDITIITSDTDYLQLIQPNVHVMNCKYKPVNTPKNSLGCREKDLLCKIIMGDKSDNIPAILKKCGTKTARKYIETPSLLQNKLSSNIEIQKKYTLNKLLIDFREIPNELQREFMATLPQI